MPTADAQVQADVDRRTNEILAELAAAPAAPVSAAPNKAAGASKELQRTTTGLTVGDRWRYQVVDKYKGEVVNNWSFRVDKILADGNFLSGKTKYSPEGNTLGFSDGEFNAREYSDHNHWYPKEMRVGYSESFKFKDVATRVNGNHFVQEWEGKAVVKAKERIRVPAGEFDVFRIEREATINGNQTANGSGRWFNRQTLTIWYAPEVHRYVAYEEVFRYGGSRAPDLTRVELTSFEVAGTVVATE
ncbi:MAG: hypothetical protein ACR2I0_04670 [Rhodoferax sp.]